MKAKKVIQIKEDISTTHCFVYKGQKYPFKFNLFINSAKLFLNDQDSLQNIRLINLVDKQSEDKLNIPEEIIRDFIKYVYREPIEINDGNVSILNYLATRYQIESLISYTQQYINQNQKDLIIRLLILNQNDSTVDTYEYKYIYNVLGGCEFGFCLTLDIENQKDDPFCLIDINPLLTFTIFVRSLAPVLAIILISALIYLSVISFKISKWFSAPGGISVIAKKTAQIAINGFASNFFDKIYDKILKFLEKNLNDNRNPSIFYIQRF